MSRVEAGRKAERGHDGSEKRVNRLCYIYLISNVFFSGTLAFAAFHFYAIRERCCLNF